MRNGFYLACKSCNSQISYVHKSLKLEICKGIDYLLIADSIEKGRQIVLEKRRDIDGVFLGPPLDIVFETIGLRK